MGGEIDTESWWNRQRIERECTKERNCDNKVKIERRNTRNCDNESRNAEIKRRQNVRTNRNRLLKRKPKDAKKVKKRDNKSK